MTDSTVNAGGSSVATAGSSNPILAALNPRNRLPTLRNIQRRAIPSIVSTIVPTSPTVPSDTFQPETSSGRAASTSGSTIGPSSRSGSAPTSASSPPSTFTSWPADTKRAISEDPDDLPPTYSEQEQEAMTRTAEASASRQQMSGNSLNVNQTNDSGCPYIVTAARDNLTAVIGVLIERGVNLEAADPATQRTALMEASRLGHEHIVELLINGRCRLDSRDVDGNIALHYAVWGDNVNILEKILATDKVFVDARGQANRSPLHWAVEGNQTMIANLLIHKGADYDLKDETQKAPLHLSAAAGNVQMCQLLLDCGANVSSYDGEGRTSLQIAASTDNVAVAATLLNKMTPSESNDAALLLAFFDAVKAGSVRMARTILGKGINLKKMKHPWKPAAFAAQSGNLDMLQLIIDNKCSLKVKDDDGWTPLHFAANLGHAAMVQQLLLQKISPKSTTKLKRETALHLATARGHAEVSEILINHKSVNIQAPDRDKFEPLHHAIRTGLTSVVEMLLSKGAKFNNETKYGWKPIHLAAAYGRIAQITDLLSRGVNTEEKLVPPAFKPAKQTSEAVRRGYFAEARWPHPGSRPLSLALEFGQDGAARLLLTQGAKLDSADSYGWRALHHAAFTCNHEMVELLLSRGANPHVITVDNTTPIGLGFRTAGLRVTQTQMEEVRNQLQEAMRYSKAPRFEFMKRGMTFSGSTPAAQRSLAWSTAEMTTALLAQQGPVALGEISEFHSGTGHSGGQSQPSISDVSSVSTDETDVEIGSVMTSSHSEKGRPSSIAKDIIVGRRRKTASRSSSITGGGDETPPPFSPGSVGRFPPMPEDSSTEKGKGHVSSPGPVAGPGEAGPSQTTTLTLLPHPRPGTIEMSTSPSVLRRLPELGGGEVMELAGDDKPAGLSKAARSPVPLEPAETDTSKGFEVAELPAELP